MNRVEYLYVLLQLFLLYLKQGRRCADPWCLFCLIVRLWGNSWFLCIFSSSWRSIPSHRNISIHGKLRALPRGTEHLRISLCILVHLDLTSRWLRNRIGGARPSLLIISLWGWWTWSWRSPNHCSGIPLGNHWYVRRQPSYERCKWVIAIHDRMALKDTKMPTADATEAKLRLLHLESVSWSINIHQVLTTRFHNN